MDRLLTGTGTCYVVHPGEMVPGTRVVSFHLLCVFIHSKLGAFTDSGCCHFNTTMTTNCVRTRRVNPSCCIAQRECKCTLSIICTNRRSEKMKFFSDMLQYRYNGPAHRSVIFRGNDVFKPKRPSAWYLVVSCGLRMRKFPFYVCM